MSRIWGVWQGCGGRSEVSVRLETVSTQGDGSGMVVGMSLVPTGRASGTAAGGGRSAGGNRQGGEA